LGTLTEEENGLPVGEEVADLGNEKARERKGKTSML